MFTLENIIGDIVFVSLRDKSFLSKIAIPEDLNHFKIMGQDQLGLWVEYVKKILDDTNQEGVDVTQHKCLHKDPNKRKFTGDHTKGCPTGNKKFGSLELSATEAIFAAEFPNKSDAVAILNSLSLSEIPLRLCPISVIPVTVEN